MGQRPTDDATHSQRSEQKTEDARNVHHTRSLQLMQHDAKTQDALKTNSPMRTVTATHVLQEPSEAEMESLACGQTDPCSKPIPQTKMHSLMKRTPKTSTWTR